MTIEFYSAGIAGLNVINHCMAARIHQWLPDEVYYEPGEMSGDTLKLFTGMGFKMVGQTP